MKKILGAILLLLFVQLGAQAQDRDDEIKTLGQNGKNGSFIGLSFRGTDFNKQFLMFGGVRAGWIAGRALALGIEAHGVIPITEYNSASFPTTQVMPLGGYGGFFLEPILWSNKKIHVTLPVSTGAGWLGIHRSWNDNNANAENLLEDDVFWYVEPGANVELNISRSMRVALGASKRFTKDFELTSVKSSALQNMNYYFTLKFGRF